LAADEDLTGLNIFLKQTYYPYGVDITRNEVIVKLPNAGVGVTGRAQLRLSAFEAVTGTGISLSYPSDSILALKKSIELQYLTSEDALYKIVTLSIGTLNDLGQPTYQFELTSQQEESLAPSAQPTPSQAAQAEADRIAKAINAVVSYGESDIDEVTSATYFNSALDSSEGDLGYELSIDDSYVRVKLTGDYSNFMHSSKLYLADYALWGIPEISCSFDEQSMSLGTTLQTTRSVSYNHDGSIEKTDLSIQLLYEPGAFTVGGGCEGELELTKS